MRTLILSNIIMTSLSLHAQSTPEDFINRKIVSRESPGFQYIVANREGIIYEFNGGKADLESNKAVNSETEFKAFSATKTFTSLAIMQLVEKGKLSLDEDVRQILNLDYPDTLDIRKLLAHTSGVSSKPLFTEIHAQEDDGNFNYSFAYEKIVASNLGFKYKPGTKRKYSNLGYLMLEKVVEVKSGMSYCDYLQQEIFQKLGTNHTYSFKYDENTATAYQKRRSMLHLIYSSIGKIRSYYGKKYNRFQAYRPLYLNAYGYGGILSNARSLAAFGINMLQPGILLNDPAVFNEYFTEQTLLNGKSAKHTLGWFIGVTVGNKYYSHPGGGGGYSCEVRIYPEKEMVTVFMMNTTQTLAHLKLLDKLDAYFLSAQ